ncbi:EAL domain-containing protein [Cryobacterium algoricola]|uniref:EAL domain-containing protein n=1 Tax=Cryobacterium algoricola TaxID=1259183 RepID=UPI003B96F4E0
MSLGIVAEGVETPVQAQWLVERGCYFAQGFLYSRPIRYGELVQVLRDSEF